MDQLTKAAPAVFDNILPYLIVLPLVVGGIYIVIGAGAATYQVFLRRRFANAERELDSNEISYIEKSYQEVIGYVSEKRYPAMFGLFYWGGGLLGLVVWMAVMAGGSWLLADYFSSLFEHARTAGLVVYVYEGGMIASSLVGVFSGIIMLWAFFQSMSFVAPQFSEYMYVKGGWNTLKSEERAYGEYLKSITHFVRIGRIKLSEKFDVKKFLRLGFREYEKIVYAAAAIMVGLNIYFLILDTHIYHLFAKDRIEYADYFSMKSYRIGYDEVRSVELRCNVYEDDGKEELNVSYTVVLDANHRINIFGDRNLHEVDLDKFEKVDARLDDADVGFARDDYFGWAKKDKPAFVSDCRQRVIVEYGADRGNRIADMLRADPLPLRNTLSRLDPTNAEKLLNLLESPSR